MISSLSVIIPCYNESLDTVVNSIIKVYNVINFYYEKYEIIVVDDGSTNINLKLELKKKIKIKNLFVFRNKKNRGKGYSIKKGIRYSFYDWILVTDADMSTPIIDLKNLENYTYKDKYEIIFGSRNMPGSMRVVNQPFYRVLAGKCFPFFVKVITGLNYYDTQCGFKLIHKKFVPFLSLMIIDGFAWDVELLYVAKLFGFSCKEVPVRWYNSSDSKVKLFKHSIKMLKDLFKIKKFHGKYNVIFNE